MRDTDGLQTTIALGPVNREGQTHTLELAQVAGDDNQPAAAGVTGDHCVVAADRLTAPSQRGPYLSRVSGGVGVEIHHCETLGNAVDDTVFGR